MRPAYPSRDRYAAAIIVRQSVVHVKRRNDRAVVQAHCCAQQAARDFCRTDGRCPQASAHCLDLSITARPGPTKLEKKCGCETTLLANCCRAAFRPQKQHPHFGLPLYLLYESRLCRFKAQLRTGSPNGVEGAARARKEEEHNDDTARNTKGGAREAPSICVHYTGTVPLCPSQIASLERYKFECRALAAPICAATGLWGLLPPELVQTVRSLLLRTYLRAHCQVSGILLTPCQNTIYNTAGS